MSPDGRLVVFPITEPSYDEKKEVADLWIVPADGSAKPRRLTAGKGAESGARFSPDGRRLAFAAKREDDEVSQIYVLDLAGGGEARRVTASALAARGPVWSPDGAWIAYQSAVYPGASDLEANRKAAAERKDAKSKVRVYETFPIRRWDRWLDDTSTHLFVVRADGESASGARDLLAGTALAAQPGFGAATGEGSSDDLAPEFTPDGSGSGLRRDDPAHRRGTLVGRHAPVPGPRRRRRAEGAHQRPGAPRHAPLRSRRTLSLLPGQRGLGAALRARSPGLRPLAGGTQRAGARADRGLRPLRRRFRRRPRRSHLLHGRGRGLRPPVLGPDRRRRRDPGARRARRLRGPRRGREREAGGRDRELGQRHAAERDRARRPGGQARAAALRR